MARTTLDIDDVVLRELRRRRARDGQPLGAIVSELLARALKDDGPDRADLNWASASMKARVDIGDKEAVWAALEPSP